MVSLWLGNVLRVFAKGLFKPTVPKYVIAELDGYIVLDFLLHHGLFQCEYLRSGVGEAASEHMEQSLLHVKALVLAPAQERQAFFMQIYARARLRILIHTNTHLYFLPVSGALIAVVLVTFERLDINEDQVGLRCHGSHLPAVVPLSPGLVCWCAPLAVAQGDMDLPIVSQHVNTTASKDE